MLTANKDMNMKAIFAVMYQSSWVQIPYSPEFFSGLIFTTAQVVFITAKIAYIFTIVVLVNSVCAVWNTDN